MLLAITAATALAVIPLAQQPALQIAKPPTDVQSTESTDVPHTSANKSGLASNTFRSAEPVIPTSVRDAAIEKEQKCFSSQLYALITDTYQSATNINLNMTQTDVPAESEISVQTVFLTDLDVTTNTILLSVILLLSLMLLFYGQMFALPSVVFISVFGTLFGGFVLYHFLLDRYDNLPYSTWVCWGPFVLALASAGAVAVLLLGCRSRLPWMTAFIFGGSKGFLGALAGRELFASIFPETAELPRFPLYFWIFAGVATLLTALISAHHRTSDGKSVVVIYMVVFFGAYGTSLSVDSLVNFYQEPLPNWAFLVIFSVSCVLGAVFQLFISGNSAKENRETAKKGADKARESARVMTRAASRTLGRGASSSDNVEPLVKS